MDKKLSRQILYDKKSEKTTAPTLESKPSKESSKSSIPKPGTIHQNIDSGAKIVNWINSHIYFKWSSMCLKIGIDKGNFQRILKSSSPILHEKQIEKIIPILKEYGYAE